MPVSATTSVSLNGELLEVGVGTTVADLVGSCCSSERGVAVAVGRQVVPRSAWATTVLESGDQVEIVEAAAGG